MERRQFIAGLIGIPVVGYLGATVRMRSALAASSDIQSFGFYEPLGETDAHDPSETDGTNYNMPCIKADDIAAGADKTYEFWHGHNGTNHKFTVTADHFKSLQQGKAVLVYTTMVDEHRHSLEITPNTPCENSCR